MNLNKKHRGIQRHIHMYTFIEFLIEYTHCLKNMPQDATLVNPKELFTKKSNNINFALVHEA
jgi:hypothetical protein